MNDKLKLTLIIGGIGLLLIGSSLLYHKLTANPEIAQKTESPTNQQGSDDEDSETVPYMNFTVYDKDKQPVTLSSFVGKPIILNFWASWCGPCQSEMPDFEEIYNKYNGQIEFLMINLTDGGRETLDTASDYIKKQQFHFPVYYDLDMTASSTYFVSSIPQTFFINADGQIVSYAKGAMTKSAMEDQIKRILND
ncbi:MAG: TlpA family protein disulfide reductase [Lachnospiraceae bacterium]|jgi:thiol-disulfide isomerase/thioredoxin|nr:TlpA family protein disulfide reductase [Lachnospiraceae bacterium]